MVDEKLKQIVKQIPLNKEMIKDGAENLKNNYFLNLELII